MDVARDDMDLLVVTENGYGKRTQISQYRKTNRGAKGVKTIGLTEAKGALAGALVVREHQELVFISVGGMVQRTAAGGISQQGRSATGVRVMNLKDEDAVSAVALVVDTGEDGGEEPQGSGLEGDPGAPEDPATCPLSFRRTPTPTQASTTAPGRPPSPTGANPGASPARARPPAQKSARALKVAPQHPKKGGCSAAQRVSSSPCSLPPPSRSGLRPAHRPAPIPDPGPRPRWPPPRMPAHAPTAAAPPPAAPSAATTAPAARWRPARGAGRPAPIT